MICKEAENLIPQYMDDSMDKDTVLEFMSHIRECRNCYHELETFFMVEKAMNTLDDENTKAESYDLSQLLQQDLNRKWQAISKHETRQHLTIFFGIIVLILLIGMILDLYGIFSLSYLL